MSASDLKMNSRPAVIGVGNVLVGDDGVGPAVVEEMRRRGLDTRAQLIDAGLAFSEVLCDLDPPRPLVIVDAVRGGGRPGSICRLALGELAGESGSMPSAVSLHEISILPALRMEALAGRDFTDVTIFGVQPKALAWGEGLSAPVAEAVERIVKRICHYLDERAAAGAAFGPAAACGSERK